MKATRHYCLRGTGLVRTLVVACATLSILLVCFAVYQSTQQDGRQAADRAGGRGAGSEGTDDTRSPDVSPVVDPFDPTGRGGDVPGVATGPAVIGPGRKIQMTFYPRRGDRARVELAVDAWTPVEGSVDEFELTEPDVRMRTNDGHAVRVTARHGRIEAVRRSGGGLVPSRGRLSGDVVIRYDRLTEAQRASMAPQAGDKIDPANLVEIDAEELAFDLEYSTLRVPGRLHLRASDVELETANVEIRFNEAQNRVDHLRIAGGGRVTLRQAAGRGGSPLGGGQSRSMTVVEWIRATLQARIGAKAKQAEGTPPDRPTEAVTINEEGVPVFHRQARKPAAPTAPDRYFARFDGKIEMKHYAGGEARSRLASDRLEIVRALFDKARRSVPSKAGAEGPATPEASPPQPVERIELSWNERLVVDACTEGDQRCSPDGRSSIRAWGSPARLWFPEGTASGNRLTFDPDGSRIVLEGEAQRVAEVRFAGQGVVRGAAIRSRRSGDDLLLHATGPGELIRDADDPAGDGDPWQPAGPSSRIRFLESLEAKGRFVKRTRLDLTGRLTTTEQRVLDEAVFAGSVVMREGRMGLSGERVTVRFADAGRRAAGGQRVRRVEARGAVALSSGDDELRCQALDVQLAPGPNGRSVPTTAVATGDVIARQRDRMIRARDRLAVDFSTEQRRVAVTDNASDDGATADNAPDGAQLASSQVSSDEPPASVNTALRTETRMTRLKAFGEVSVVDPTEGVDLSAQTLDCTFGKDGAIERATVRGTADEPASVRLNTMTVTGEVVHVDVGNEWAEVPSGGRMTFPSRRDLDGRRLDRPIPVSISWSERMKYQGRENRAVFWGDVHAASASTTTFDCAQLEAEFADAVVEPSAQPAWKPWWTLAELIDRLAPGSGSSAAASRDRRLAKEVTSLLATGHAVALTSELDPETGAVLSRARIAGPRLSVNLRAGASKMLIEGPGSLLLEDYRPEEPPPGSQVEDPNRFLASGGGGTTPARAVSGKPTRAEPRGAAAHPADGGQAVATGRRDGALFSAGSGSGPSNTLIEWQDSMWYDFSIRQTRFEGDVKLKYFSGPALARLRQGAASLGSGDGGRATFLSCDVLKVDFQLPDAAASQRRGNRLGGLRSDRLRQFEATGSVSLQDSTENLYVTADRVVYWKDSELLGIFAHGDRRAHISKKPPGQLPNQVSVKRMFYNLRTGELEAAKPAMDAR